MITLLRILWLGLLLTVPGSRGFQCTNNQVGSCSCQPGSQVQYEIFCPTLIESRVHIKFEPTQWIQFTCQRGVTEEEMISFLPGLELGPLKIIKIQNCPIPVNPLREMISAMGVVNIENIEQLAFRNVPRSSTQKFEGYHFQNLTGVQRLSLVRSSLGQLSKAFFQEITQVKSIELNGNRIRLEGDTFTDLTELMEFICNSCQIDTIEGNLFSGLTKLKSISLHNNKISSLYPGTFDSQVSLEHLNLENNDLQTFPDNIFDKMESLRILQIDRNKFTTFPDYLFKFNKNFTHFELLFLCTPARCLPENVKKLTFPEKMFHDSSVKTIKMLWVPANDLPENFLKGSKDLVNLTMQRMMMTSIPEGLFKDTESIKLIDFSANKIESLPPTLFRNLERLESLRFIDNKIRSLDDNLFKGLKNLKIFHFNENLITRLGSHVFANLNNMEEVDLSNNNITLGDYGHFTSTNTWEKLKTLNLSGNNIDKIPTGTDHLMLSLLNLDLSNNKLGLGPELGLTDFNNFLKNKKHGDFVLNMSNNLIKKINLENPYGAEIKNTGLKLNLEGNPIICDCTVTLLKRLIDRDTELGPLNDLMEISPPAVRCGEDSPPRNRRKFLNDPSLDFRDLNCPFNKTCPEPCSCSYNTYYKQTFMDCSNRNLTRFPSNLVLRNESEKIVLDLSDNQISNLTYAVDRYNSGDEGAKLYQKISQLFLTRNQISVFKHDCLPGDLEELYLDRNRISEFQQSDINYFELLINRTNLRLRLGNNPYSCSCDSTPLFHLIKNNGAKLNDTHTIMMKCDSQQQPLALWKLKLEDFCKYGQPWYTNVIIGVLFLLLVVAITSVVFTVKREIIIIWIYSKPWGRKLFSEDLIDKDKPYDAFLSYAQADSEFVEKDLLGGLESPEDNSEKYKCLIHTRDWNAGEMIPDQIMHSVESSRRTIIVLSKPYIQSMWTKLEFRAAHTQALQDKTQRVIIIVKGELPKNEEMEEDLQKYISLNTYLHADDPWFWQKLRYALPHRGNLIKKRTRRETDKLELMRSQAELELGKRSPSPKTLDVKTLIKLDQPGNTNVTNVTNGHANGVPIGFGDN